MHIWSWVSSTSKATAWSRIRTAEEEAQKMLCTDENVRYMMALSVCSQSDREGMALLRFVQGYLSDEPMGDYLRGVYYSGLYTTENKPLDTDLARICLKRAAESGFEKADDAYFRLSNLELKRGNVAQCEVYLKKAARMGNENARAVCEECGYSW